MQQENHGSNKKRHDGEKGQDLLTTYVLINKAEAGRRWRWDFTWNWLQPVQGKVVGIWMEGGMDTWDLDMDAWVGRIWVILLSRGREECEIRSRWTMRSQWTRADGH